MIDRMKRLLQENDLCVLATALDDKPHCSLMAYVTDEDAGWVYMLTHRASKKYQNLIRNPRASLLVDTRLQAGILARERIQALTVYGAFHEQRDVGTRNEIIRRVLRRHPHLGEFAGHPQIEVLAIRPSAFLLLDGVSDAQYQELRDPDSP